MNKKILITIILGIFLFSFAPLVNAESIGIKQVNVQMEITNYCLSGDCTYINLTTITYPNGSLISLNAEMTNNYQTFNYSYTPTEIGTYYFNTCGNPEGVVVCEIDSFEVTPNGKENSTQDSILYIGLLIGLIIFFIVTAYGAISLPYKDVVNERGKIISVNDKKYLKILSIFACYGVLTWLSNIMIYISNILLNNSITMQFFTIMFKILMGLLYPMLIFTIIIIAIQFSKDLKLKNLLDRGL